MLVVPEWPSLGLFMLTALVLLLTPGPAVLYIVTRRRAGLVSVLGVHVGTLAHIFAAAVGISAVLAASATAFSVVSAWAWRLRCRAASSGSRAAGLTGARAAEGAGAPGV